MTPAAIKKADSLLRHAAYLGVRPTEFMLTLTLGEAYELLDYLAAGGMGQMANHALLVKDIEAARAAGDPFSVLEHFHVKGLSILAADELH